MLYYLAITLYIIVCFFLLVVVLIQPGQLGRGGSSFGGGSGGGGTAGRGASSVFKRVTTGAAVLFMLLSIALSRHNADKSAVDDVAPITPPTAPASRAKPESDDKNVPVQTNQAAAPVAPAPPSPPATPTPPAKPTPPAQPSPAAP